MRFNGSKITIGFNSDHTQNPACEPTCITSSGWYKCNGLTGEIFTLFRDDDRNE